MSLTMQQKRGTSDNWADINPILLAGEIGFETDTNRIKIGNGVSAWVDLEYVTTIDELGTFGNNSSESLISIESDTVIDTVVASQWRSLKYVISMLKSSGGVNKFATTELTILIDNSELTVSEYGVVDNNGEVGTVSVSKDGGLVKVSVAPNLLVKPITVRFYRTGLKA